MKNRQEIYREGNIAEQDISALDRTLDLLDAVGLKYSTVMGKGDTSRGVGVILEGGVEPLNVLRVPGANDLLTDGTGFLGRISERKMKELRRYLLSYVIKELEKQGAMMIDRIEYGGSACDAIHIVQISDRKVSLVLM
jgi:hypothetical protein